MGREEITRSGTWGRRCSYNLRSDQYAVSGIFKQLRTFVDVSFFLSTFSKIGNLFLDLLL